MKKINPDEVKKVLISRTDKLGDAILALPLAAQAKKVFKNAGVFF